MPLYPWPLRDLASITVDPQGFSFVFHRRNALQNLGLRLFYEMPFRVLQPVAHYGAKLGRGWRKLTRVLSSPALGSTDR
jgi:hypothetical protein